MNLNLQKPARVTEEPNDDICHDPFHSWPLATFIAQPITEQSCPDPDKPRGSALMKTNESALAKTNREHDRLDAGKTLRG